MQDAQIGTHGRWGCWEEEQRWLIDAPGGAPPSKWNIAAGKRPNNHCPHPILTRRRLHLLS